LRYPTQFVAENREKLRKTFDRAAPPLTFRPRNQGETAHFCSFHRTREDHPMNKNDLVAAVAEKTGVPKAEAEKIIDATLDTVTGTLKGGDEVRLVGFGTFVVTTRKAGTGRNPRTGEEIKIPASKQPKFRAGKQLKDAVNV